MSGFHLSMLREQTGMSQERVGGLCNVSGKCIDYWEDSPTKEIPTEAEEVLRNFFYGNPAGSKWGYA